MEDGEIVDSARDETPSRSSGPKTNDDRDKRRTKWSALMGDVYKKLDREAGPSRSNTDSTVKRVEKEVEEGEYEVLRRPARSSKAVLEPWEQRR
jgi:hypothetical protein